MQCTLKLAHVVDTVGCDYVRRGTGCWRERLTSERALNLSISGEGFGWTGLAGGCYDGVC